MQARRRTIVCVLGSSITVVAQILATLLIVALMLACENEAQRRTREYEQNGWTIRVTSAPSFPALCVNRVLSRARGSKDWKIVYDRGADDPIVPWGHTVSFLADEVAVIEIDDHLEVTTDGGATWRWNPLPVQERRAPHMVPDGQGGYTGVPPRSGLYLTSGGSGTYTSETGKTWRTSDFGRTWEAAQ